MPKPQPSEQDLLKDILQPLLVDFEYWFSKSIELLTNQEIEFLTPEQQADLQARVENARREVATAQMLFQATDGQVGIESSQMLGWHQLVSECWKVAMKLRQPQDTKIEDRE
jgi:hypothetical protein